MESEFELYNKIVIQSNKALEVAKKKEEENSVWTSFWILCK